MEDKIFLQLLDKSEDAVKQQHSRLALSSRNMWATYIIFMCWGYNKECEKMCEINVLFNPVYAKYHFNT